MAKKILIIDDDIDLVEAMRITLEGEGFEIIDAQEGSKGLEKIRSEELCEFITRKFRNTKKMLSCDLASLIVNLCENHPYYIQYLCHIVWENEEKGKVQEQTIHQSLKDLVRRNKTVFEATWDSLTNNQRIKLIEKTIDQQIRPALQADGGDLELLDVMGNRVLVAFRGMCAQCRVAEFTMAEVVEKKLRQFVSPDITVEEVSS